MKNSSVIEDDIEPAEALLGEGDHCFRVFRFRYVGRECARIRPYLLRRRLGCVFLQIDDDHLRPLAREEKT